MVNPSYLKGMEKTRKNMRDSIKTFTHTALDSLQQNPILKGVVPTVGSVGLTFIEEIEIGLRITGVLIGIVIGCLTLYVKAREAAALHKNELSGKKAE